MPTTRGIDLLGELTPRVASHGFSRRMLAALGACALPYLSDNVVKYGVHRAMAKLGIETAKGVHVGIHCFRHGVTSELLESGTPIHVVTRLMRHADSNVTLEHYAHIVGDAERVASEKFSQRIGQNITQLESGSELESTSSVKTA